METEFSVNISKLRKERGLNQRKAASELNISQALLSHYENGIREPGLDFVVRACDYYGVSADFILGRTNIRETVLAKSEPGNEGAENAAIDKMKQDALIFAASIFRLIMHCSDEVAIAALSYMVTSEYRLLCELLSVSDSDLISSDVKKAKVLSEVDSKLLILSISEEAAKQSTKITAELIRKNVSKPTFKSFEAVVAKIEERLGVNALKMDRK